MAVCVGLPEAVVLCAFGQWIKAMSIRKTWIEKYPDPLTDIGITGGFFVVMGAVTVGETVKVKVMKDRVEGRTTTLTCDGFEEYVKLGYINPENFSRRAAADKGRASALVKVLVFGQASWFVVQCIARAFYHLTTTLLEIHVSIQVLYSFAGYAFWFHKPLDVNETIHIDLPPGVLPFGLPETTDLKTKTLTVTENYRPGTIILGLRAFYDIGEFIGHRKTTFATALLTGINGGCHAAAWNTQFPSFVEGALWRIASLSICVVPFVLALLFQHGGYRQHTGPILWGTRFLDYESPVEHTQKIASEFTKAIVDIAKGKKGDQEPANSLMEFIIPTFRIFTCIVTLSLYIFYILCMTYITLESFISVRRLPKGAYNTPRWGGYAPYIE